MSLLLLLAVAAVAAAAAAAVLLAPFCPLPLHAAILEPDLHLEERKGDKMM